MITLTATIELDKGNSTLNNATSNIERNNISSTIDLVLNENNKSENPFLLGVSKLGNGATLQEKVPYFISSQCSNKEGVFETPFLLNIFGNNITAVKIVFDKQNNVHPKTIFINGQSYSNNSNDFQIVSSKTSQINIEIKNLNKPEHPLIIQGIYISFTYELNNINLQSLEFKRVVKPEINMPSFGIISNAGNTEFIDFDNSILQFIEKDLIKEKLSVSIYLNNHLSKSSQQVAKTYTYDWKYDNDNKIVNIALKDDLEEWQDIFVTGISFDTSMVEAQPFAYIYKNLWSKTPSKFKMLSFEELDETTREVLNRTYCYYPVLKSGSLWGCWQKLCVVCQLYIYKNSNDETVCSYLLGA